MRQEHTQEFETGIGSFIGMSSTCEEEIPLNERIIVALDVATIDEARQIVNELGDTINFYKIGMQLQFSGGIQLAKELIEQGKKVFLDSKLFDIDATIEKAVRNIADLGVHFLTVHGNMRTIAAAVRGRKGTNLKILSVTVLTSLDNDDIKDLGFNEVSVEELVLHRAKRAIEVGADGVIASGQEASIIKNLQGGDDLTLITPGIRERGAAQGDQRRTATAQEAIESGADYLVIGRPITQSNDMLKTVKEFQDNVQLALSKRVPLD